MGMGLVQKLVEKGWKVAIADINDNKKFAEELGDASSFHKCNVADYDRCVEADTVPCHGLTSTKPGRNVPAGLGQVWEDRCVVCQRRYS